MRSMHASDERLSRLDADAFARHEERSLAFTPNDLKAMGNTYVSSFGNADNRDSAGKSVEEMLSQSWLRAAIEINKTVHHNAIRLQLEIAQQLQDARKLALVELARNIRFDLASHTRPALYGLGRAPVVELDTRSLGATCTVAHVDRQQRQKQGPRYSNSPGPTLLKAVPHSELKSVGT